MVSGCLRSLLSLVNYSTPGFKKDAGVDRVGQGSDVSTFQGSSSLWCNRNPPTNELVKGGMVELTFGHKSSFL
jgi:hypothetical protein